MKACTVTLLLLALGTTLVFAAPSGSTDYLRATVEKTVCKAGVVSVSDVIRIAAEAEVTKREMSEMKAKLGKQCPSDGDSEITMGLENIGQLQKQTLTDMKRLFQLVASIQATGGIQHRSETTTTATTTAAAAAEEGAVVAHVPPPGGSGLCFTPELTCFTGYGHHYRGTASVTESGKTCQHWDQQSPHVHTRTSTLFPHDDLVQNYCRNPDYETKPWCYTTDPTTRWAHCDIPRC
ncbi:hypothetical protein Bbelb_024100 [Branchiostoma belcheri]|nr:hypothetical protein Bbelb_024100 [Branchiostoma belcheri]